MSEHDATSGHESGHAHPHESSAEISDDGRTRHLKSGCLAASLENGQITFRRVHEGCTCSLDLTEPHTERDADKLLQLLGQLLSGSSIYQ